MGSGASVLSEEAIKSLENSTNFTSKEIIRILKRYSYYDPDNTQCISLKAFLNVPEVSSNPIMRKVGELFLDPQTRSMSPSDFVKLFSVLSSRTTAKKRKEFAFKVLDTDGNGYLSYDEVFNFYSMLLRPAFSDDYILHIVMTTVNNNSSDNEGLSSDDFLNLVTDKEIGALFTVDLQLP